MAVKNSRFPNTGLLLIIFVILKKKQNHQTQYVGYVENMMLNTAFTTRQLLRTAILE